MVHQAIDRDEFMMRWIIPGPVVLVRLPPGPGSTTSLSPPLPKTSIWSMKTRTLRHLSFSQWQRGSQASLPLDSGDTAPTINCRPHACTRTRTRARTHMHTHAGHTPCFSCTTNNFYNRVNKPCVIKHSYPSKAILMTLIEHMLHIHFIASSRLNAHSLL